MGKEMGPRNDVAEHVLRGDRVGAVEVDSPPQGTTIVGALQRILR